MLLHGEKVMLDKAVSWVSIVSSPMAVYLTSFWVNVEPAVRVIVVIGTFAVTVIVNWKKLKSQIREWTR